MGNNDSKSINQTHGQVCNPEDERKHTISLVFKEITEGGSVKLTADHFKKALFPDQPELSDVVFTNMVPTYGPSEAPEYGLSKEITQEQFVRYCSDLMNLNTSTEQTRFYYKMFAESEDNLLQHCCGCLLSCCYNAALSLCSCPTESPTNTQTLTSNILKHMFGNEPSITETRFTSWVNKHCSDMVSSLHKLVSHRLANKHKQPGASSLPVLYSKLGDSSHLLSVYTSWLLSCQLSHSYIPSLGGAVLGPVLPLNSILQDGWHLLYDSNSQGLSVNRFQHHVFQYKAPTVTLISFEGHCYCLAVQSEWKEDVKSWGGGDCSLVQILPEFKLVQSGSEIVFFSLCTALTQGYSDMAIQGGSDLVFLNFSLRSLPKGIQIGSDSRSRVLEIEEDLHKVKHFGMSTPLHRLEVWGCGGDHVRDAQKKQKDWEKKDTMKQKDRKLKIDVDEWKSSPDRQLLELGGVTTEHAER